MRGGVGCGGEGGMVCRRDAVWGRVWVQEYLADKKLPPPP